MNDPGPTLYDLAKMYVAAVDLYETHPHFADGAATVEYCEDALVDHFEERRHRANMAG